MENNYKEYLDSFAWKAIKQVKLSEQPECECCGETATTVHHLSYERRGSEKEDDIVSICERCHNECHFVNGYQIKNDEETLRKRFEEVRGEFGGNNEQFDFKRLSEYKYKYEIYNLDIYINGIKSKNLCSFYVDSYIEHISYNIYYNGQGLFYVSEYSGDEKENNYEKFTDLSKHLIFTQNNKDESFKYKIIKLYKIEGIKIFNIKIFENKEYIGIFDNIYYLGNIFREIDITSFKTIGKRYLADKNYVYYGFGTIIKNQADPKSFESLNDKYYKDKNYVYYYNEILKGADSESFSILKNNYNKTGPIYYGKDKNHVYYDGKIIELADPESFEIINSWYLKDKNNIYNYKGELIKGLDSTSFKILNNKFYKDKNHVYYDGEIIEGVISDGFEIIVPGLYYKDKKHVFYKGQIIEGCDSKSFVFINNEYSYSDDYEHSNYYNNKVIHNYSKDKNQIYYNGKVINLLDPKSFEIIVEGIYHKDKNYVFYKGKVIEGADSKTFTKLNEHYCKDKNYVYCDSEKVKYDGIFFTTYADPKTFEVTGLYSGKDIKYKFVGAEKSKY